MTAQQLIIGEGFASLVEYDAKSEVVEEISRLEWTPETFVAQLSKLFSELKRGSVRVLLTDDLSYVLAVSVSKQIAGERTLVQAEVAKKVPEHLHRTIWDFSEVGVTESGEHLLQVFVVAERVYALLQLLDEEFSKKIDSIVPVSISLKELLSFTTPTLVLHSDSYTSVAVIGNKGLILVSLSLVHANLKTLKRLLAAVKNDHGLALKEVVVSGYEPEIVKQLVEEEITVHTLSLNPTKALEEKKDIFGKDTKVLNVSLKDSLSGIDKSMHLEVLDDLELSEKTSSRSKLSFSKNMQRSLLVLGVALFVLFLIVGAALWFRPKQSIESPVASTEQFQGSEDAVRAEALSSEALGFEIAELRVGMSVEEDRTTGALLAAAIKEWGVAGFSDEAQLPAIVLEDETDDQVVVFVKDRGIGDAVLSLLEQDVPDLGSSLSETLLTPGSQYDVMVKVK